VEISVERSECQNVDSVRKGKQVGFHEGGNKCGKCNYVHEHRVDVLHLEKHVNIVKIMITLLSYALKKLLVV